MIRLFAGAGLVSVFTIAGLASAAEEVYNIDPVHSQPMFEVRHMGFSIQRGSFTKASGRITLDRAHRRAAWPGRTPGRCARRTRAGRRATGWS